MAKTAARRPIAARNLALSQATAKWLASRDVTPNAISVWGVIAATIAGLLLAATPRLGALAPLAWVAGAALVQLRLLANMFDGMVAIESGKTSKLGELYNEVPDRIADTAVLLGLGYAAGGEPWLGYAAALGAMFTAYVRTVGVTAGAEAQFCGPMAKPHRMAMVIGTSLVCALAQLVGLPFMGLVGGYGLPALALAIVFLGSLVTAWRRLSRIASALR